MRLFINTKPMLSLVQHYRTHLLKLQRSDQSGSGFIIQLNNLSALVTGAATGAAPGQSSAIPRTRTPTTPGTPSPAPRAGRGHHGHLRAGTVAVGSSPGSASCANTRAAPVRSQDRRNSLDRAYGQSGPGDTKEASNATKRRRKGR